MSKQDQLIFDQISGINTENQDFDFLSIDFDLEVAKESNDVWGVSAD